MIVVQHPQRVQPRHRAFAALLPVDPPEVVAHLFQRAVHLVKIHPQKGRVGGVKVDGFAFLRVTPQRPGGGGIALLVGADAVRRMDVQGHFHAHLVKPPCKALRVREKLAVPGVARPAGSESRVDVHQMPIHVHHGHGEGQVLGGEALHQRQVFLLGVAVKTAPPAAQRIAGQQRLRPAEMVKIRHACFKVPVITEEIEVLPRSVGRDPAVRCQGHGAAVVQHGAALPGKKAVLQRDVAVRAVQRAGGAADGVQFHAVAPGRADAARPCHRDGQPAGSKGTAVIAQMQVFGEELQPFAPAHRPVFHRRKIPEQGHLGGAVLKGAGLGVFQTQQAAGEHTDAPTLPFHHRGGRAQGPGLDAVSFQFHGSFLLRARGPGKKAARHGGLFHAAPWLVHELCRGQPVMGVVALAMA